MKWDFDNKNITFSIFPNSKLKEDEEIFDEYDKIPNSKLLLMHGFSIENNKYDEMDVSFEATNLQHKQNFGRWKLETQLLQDCLNADLLKFAKSMPETDSNSP